VGAGPLPGKVVMVQSPRVQPILDAIKATRGSSHVTYTSTGISTIKSDVAVVVVGETPYAEGNGDNPNPQLSTGDLSVIANIQNLGIPYVVLLISGRPIILNNVITDANAFVCLLVTWN